MSIKYRPNICSKTFAILLSFVAFSSCKESTSNLVQIPDNNQGALVRTPADKKYLSPEIEKLLSEEKFQAAQEKIKARTDELISANKLDDEYVDYLLNGVKLEMALHGYETAVKQLQVAKRPKDLIPKLSVELVYAQALYFYFNNYSWEINKREKVESKDKDLKLWSASEIFEEIFKTLNIILKDSKELYKASNKEIEKFVELNSYPAGIRDTLLDTVTHIFVDIIENRQSWLPSNESEISELKLKDLLSETPLGDFDYSDKKIHPLTKVANLLATLRQFHKKAGNIGASIDTRISQFETIFHSLQNAEDKEILLKTFREKLESEKSHRWYSWGMASLARLTQSGTEGNAIIRAREIAVIGEKAFPESEGAKACSDIIYNIELPQFSIGGMAIDAPQKRSIEVSYKNIKKLYFRSYAFDLQKHVRNQKDYSFWPSYREIESINKSSPTKSWQVDLTETTDFQMHKHFVTTPQHPFGHYFIFASMDENFSSNENIIDGIQMIFSNLILVKESRAQNGNYIIRVLDGLNGTPIKGTHVGIFKLDYKKGPQSVFDGLTDTEGRIEAPLKSLGVSPTQWSSFFAIAQKQNDFSITLNAFNVAKEHENSQTKSQFIFLDRAIYRPGQKIYFKVLGYSGDSRTGNFKVSVNEALSISLFDANNEEISKLNLKSDKFGSAFGEVVIPSGKMLGNWSLRSGSVTSAYFKVEEYKRPTFEVKIPDQTKAWKLGAPVSVNVEAKYYFGSPVSGGKFEYSIFEETRMPWWAYFGGFNFYWTRFTQRNLLKSGKGILKDDGTFTIDFTPKLDQRLGDTVDDVSKIYSFEAIVTDEGGETRTVNRSFPIAKSDITLGISSTESFIESNSSAEFSMTRNSLQGIPKAGKSSAQIITLAPRHSLRSVTDYPLPEKLKTLLKSEFQTEGDLQLSRQQFSFSLTQHLSDWKEGEKVQESGLLHKEDGLAVWKVAGLKAGAYRMRVTSVDSFNEKVSKDFDFIVVDSKSTLQIPFVAKVDKSSVEVGGKVKLFVHSAYANQKIMVEKTRYGQIQESKILTVGKDSSILEFPVKENDRGGFELRTSLLNDFAFLSENFSINVPWSNKELKLEFSRFRDELIPGQEEKWILKVSGPNGNKLNLAQAQILAFMYDKSLDAMNPLYVQNLNSIFARSNLMSVSVADLGPAQSAYWGSVNRSHRSNGSGYRDDSLKFYPNYGIGGPGSRSSGMRGKRMKGNMVSDSLSEGHSEEALDMAAAPAPGGAKMLAKQSFGGAAVGKAKSEKKSDQEGRSDKDAPSERNQEGSTELRTAFQETAFFKPDLLLNDEGGVDIQFKVPDSVTAWKFNALAHTQDMLGGQITKETRTIKDLLVRPYLPRFFREGDKFELKVMVNNSSKKDLSGSVKIQIFDHLSKKDITNDFIKGGQTNKAFSVGALKSESLNFSLDVKNQLGQIDVKVIGESGAFKDGEQKSLLILPATQHLAESKFRILKDKDKKILSFDDLEKSTDPTLVNEKLVVTLNSQLFYNVLSALPYLVNYPYECSEQTLNRFVSTGILGSLYKEFPAIAKMAKTMSSRSTQLEKWDPNDPNRKIALEESPWVLESKGGEQDPENLKNVLDERIVKTTRDDAIAKLRKSQTALGGFPWFAGGPPSPYITLYVLYGFSKALEFGVDVPKDMTQKAWGYLHRHYIDELFPRALKDNCCWEEITFLNYVLTNYPSTDWSGDLFTTAERKQMADFSFKHWKDHSPYLKGYLALTLNRMDRAPDAKLVWDSVLDSAKTSEDEGTHWAREDRSWLWYNDTTETQAFALRTGMELKSDPKLLDGLVLWLFINKKLNHWSSTRSTSEVVYSLAHYLKATKQLGVKEEAKVSFANGFKQDFEFPADTYMGGKNQIVIEGDKLNSKSVPVTVEKSTPGYLFASATWHYSTKQLAKESKGDFLKINRSYFKRVKKGLDYVLEPLNDKSTLALGDEVEVSISISSKHSLEYVHLKDPRPSGFEPVSQTSRHRWDLGIYWYEEVRDSATNFFFERLPKGEYNFKYRVRVAAGGVFRIGSAMIQPLYAPEFVATSAGQELKVSK